MSRRARKRQNRRDRRKARQTKWRRQGKTNPKKIGHGPSGSETILPKGKEQTNG